MRLDQMIAALPAESLHEATVDISAYLGESAGTEYLLFREPDVPRLFQIAEDALLIRRRYPEWPETLATSVALLSLSHLAPESSESIAHFYCHLADKRRQMFLDVLQQFRAAFPHLTDLGAAMETEKKDSADSED